MRKANPVKPSFLFDSPPTAGEDAGVVAERFIADNMLGEENRREIIGVSVCANEALDSRFVQLHASHGLVYEQPQVILPRKRFVNERQFSDRSLAM